MTSDELLDRLFELLDRDDQYGIVRLLSASRSIVLTERSDRAKRAQIVRINSDESTITVIPAGPRIGEREALIIRTEVNQRLLACRTGLDRLIVDFRNVLTVNSCALTLFADLRRNASIFGAKTDGVGIEESVARRLRRITVQSANARHRRNPLKRFFGNVA